MPALKVSNLGKRYQVFGSPRARLRALLTGRQAANNHWALSEVSFELGKGQCLGVIGSNGAGKSTLLKLITGTVRPTTGSVARQGRLSAILELGAGFHPQFSGRDNLYFGGALIGIEREQMSRLVPSILDFAELGEAIDRPVKTYSSGMTVRLAFSLVTAVEPELLIIDEALAVGDQRFQKKCTDRIEAFRKAGCTILFCSHSQYHIRRLCDVALWLDHGRVRAFGGTEHVLSAYETHVRLLEAEAQGPPDAGGPVARPAAAGGRKAAIRALAIADLGDGDPPQLASKDLAVTVRAHVRGGERPNFAVMLEQARGVGITSVTTHYDGAEPRLVGDELWEATVTFHDLPVHSGDYVVSAYLFDSEGIVVYDEWYQHTVFRWVYPARSAGLVSLPHRWS
ncbi:MAG: ABC transporter ATP-binding protein [Rhodocyclaceae bacterium]|nr:ABC transporter ATP-binding protein [Rhodocyclaceae bacterium]